MSKPNPLCQKLSGTVPASQEFEPIGDILQRLRFDRASLEARMTAQFDQPLSLRLDALVLLEEELDGSPAPTPNAPVGTLLNLEGRPKP